jgi:hypothetical protein
MGKLEPKLNLWFSRASIAHLINIGNERETNLNSSSDSDGQDSSPWHQNHRLVRGLIKYHLFTPILIK